MDDHCLENEQPLACKQGMTVPSAALVQAPFPESCVVKMKGRPAPSTAAYAPTPYSRAGYESPPPTCIATEKMPCQPVKSVCRTIVIHVCLMMLAMTNITSGILIANEYYDRLPGPLLLSVLFSIFCAVFQNTGER